MKLLWFEVTEPGRYKCDGAIIAGWQDSLETIVRGIDDVELTIAFEDKSGLLKKKNVGSVEYVPLNTKMNLIEKIQSKWSWNVSKRKLISAMCRVVENYKPDLIHVFGTEWPFGLVAKYVKVPVVVHIQGAIIPYNNSLFPPCYSYGTKIRNVFPNIKKIIGILLEQKKNESRVRMEREIWDSVNHYMGRTNWDEAVSGIMNPRRHYYFVNEALRSSFIEGKDCWNGVNTKGKIVLLSTGCSSFWKGPEMLLKTAKILSDLQVDFVWHVAGKMPAEIKKLVEKKEKLSFESCHVVFDGFLSHEALAEKLCNATLYIHTAYIENSPNSICEAQCLGVPIVATNVGGISSLISNGVDGTLVPANDPWQMAYGIVNLIKNENLLLQYSKKSREKALKRHSPELIRRQLMECYSVVLKIGSA